MVELQEIFREARNNGWRRRTKGWQRKAPLLERHAPHERYGPGDTEISHAELPWDSSRPGVPHQGDQRSERGNQSGMTGAAQARLERDRPLPHDHPTKLRALELFAEFFCLRTNDAAMLLRDHPITESYARSVRRTLSILHRDGFLYRAPYLDPARERGGIA